jgi:hypothetical protein
MKVFRPLFFVMAFVLIVGLACSFGTGDTTQQAPTQPPAQEVPTDAPQVQEPPTAEPPTAEPATVEPTAPTLDKFFTQEFDADPGSDWKYNVIGPNSESSGSKATYTFDASRMAFKIEAEDLYAYYTYQGQSYDDVRVDINFENRGVNSQQVSLTCRVSDEGWYEFSVQSDGLWYLWAVENNKYTRLANGGSTKIKQGKAVNEYGLLCQGEKLSFFINGNEPKGSPYSERKFAFRRGGVGFNVSSLRATPVRVEVDWFKVSQP